MAEDREALLQHYRQMRAELLVTIDGLDGALLSERLLDGWSVKDHLAHIALWDELRASEVERIAAGHASAWRMSGEQDATYNELAYDLRRDLPPAQVRWELARTHERLLAAIAGAGERGLDATLYGEAGLRSRHEAQHTGWIGRWRREKSI
ncbi:MAG TPA: DinB family protein [Dehalococcoidia bacterium]|nr:DinB family protein [Dehalococcoidia bacterium]